MPSLLEAEFEAATLDLYSGNALEALNRIDALLKNAPNASKLFEFKALCLESLGKKNEALSIYSHLLEVGPQDQFPKYHFRAGLLELSLKRHDPARRNFEFALEENFNPLASHYYLGMIDYAEGRFNAAQRHLVLALLLEDESIRSMARYILGNIDYGLGKSSRAFYELEDSVACAEEWNRSGSQEEKTIASSFLTNSQRLLEEIDRSQLSGQMSFRGQYDSNIRLLSDAVQAGARDTGKAVLVGGIAYAASPRSRFRTKAQYLTFLNLNTNPSSRDFEFFTHAIEVESMWRKRARFEPGIRLGGNFSMQNQASGRQERLRYAAYSLLGKLGGFVRSQLSPQWQTEFESYYLPKKYYLDPGAGDERRSGDGFLVRAKLEYLSASPLFTPTGSLSFERDNSRGRSFRSSEFGFGLANTAYLNAKNALEFKFEMSFSKFNERSPKRADTKISSYMAWNHSMSRNWSILTDANFIKVSSNIATPFSYKRYFGGVGLTRSF